MTNRLSDLNHHLFNQLDRLSGNLSPEEIEQEVARTQAIVQVADQITDNAKTMLSAAKLYAEHGQHILPMLPQIGAQAKTEDQA